MKVNFDAAGIAKSLEMHIEKILLGVAGACVLVMGFFFIVTTPNTIQFDNKTITPSELNQAIFASSENLKRAYDNAKPETSKQQQNSEELKKRQLAGVFAKDPKDTTTTIPLKPTLRLASRFGSKIEIPGLQEIEQTSTAISLVTPLAPTQPVPRGGRSMVTVSQLKIDRENKPVEPGTESIEQPWISIASYFDRKSQQAELSKAGYAAARQNVYIAGVDAQRREKLATGEWSEWQDVKPGKAMPAVELVEPKFDDVTGAMTNHPELEETWQLIKNPQTQTVLMQPPFPTVNDGDEWAMPPLPGFEDKEEEEGKPVVKAVKPTTPTPPAGPRGGRQPVVGGGGRGGRGIGPEGGSGRPVAPQNDEKAKEEAKKQAAEELKEAKKAVTEKNWQEAKNRAESVQHNENAAKADQTAAGEIIKKADKELEKLAKTGSPGNPLVPGGGLRMPPGEGGNPRMPGGGRGVGPAPMAPLAQTVSTLVTDPSPNTNRPAVWFHDDTVESGKTYSYRLRVRIWNRYVGQTKFVKNPEDAKKAVVAGEWSAPSDPVTVTPSTYFFAKAAKPGGAGASVDIFKWRKGKWVKQSFDVAVGEVIGGTRKVTTEDDIDNKKTEVDFTTGAVVLDIRPSEPVKVRVPGKNGAYTEREQTSLVLVYLDPADGQVKERIPALDRFDPIRKSLDAEGG